MPTLVERARELEQKRGELAALFEKHRKDDSYDMPVEVIEQVNKRNEELDQLGKAFAEYKKLDTVAERNAAALAELREVKGIRHTGGPPESRGDALAIGQPVQQKSLGEMFVESVAFKTGKKVAAGFAGPSVEFEDVSLKTLFQTTAGFAPETFRTGRVVPYAVERIAVVDLVPQTETSQAAVVYMEETTHTNNAAETAEAGTYPESAFALTERTSTVRKIATSIPVTDEQFDDEPRARDFINNRLTYQLRARLDSQILVGDGIAPNLTGVLNVSGINSQAKSTDPTPDAIFKAMILINRLGFTDATGIVMHPTDWQAIRLLRTPEGIYIWGNPAERGMSTIWGLPVVVSTFETQGTALLGDWAQFSELAVRKGIELQVTNSHSTDFLEGKKRIRADVRVAFIVYRAKAFAKVTGL